MLFKSNKLPIVSLFPSENSPENGDKGRFLSAELPREHVAVGFEQDMLVDELRQSPSDQDSPIAPPDSTLPTAVTPWDDFFTRATFSGDEISQTLPSTTHSEDPYLFDISFGTMPVSLQTSAADVSCHYTSGQ